jgi:hypothetical protein
VENMKNILCLAIAFGSAAVLILTLFNEFNSEAQTSANPNNNNETRGQAREQCLAENKMNVDFTAGQKLTYDQLLVMDKCMESKGFPVGPRQKTK